MKRLASLVVICMTVLGLVMLSTEATAAPAPPPQSSDGSSAAQGLADMMRDGSISSAAATPGGPVVEQPGITLPTSAGSAGRLQIRTTSCADLAAKLAAGSISSYNCTSVRAVTAKEAPAEGLSKGAAAAAVAWPAGCSTGSGTLINWTAVSRRAACNHTQFGIVTTEQPSGKVIGTTNMHAVNTMVASTTSARWAMVTNLWVFGFTGVGFPSSVTGSFFPGGCTGCLGTGRTWTTLADGASWRGTENLDVTGMAANAIVPNVNGFWETTLSGAGWGNSVIVTYYSANSRCDNTLASLSRPAGCVFSNIPGVAGFSQTTVPEFVRHVYNAQLSGLPGRLSTATYLTKLSDPTLQSRNGTKACPSTLPRPTTAGNWDCDEYPFRSTYQGASTSGATLARSQSWCQMPDPARTGASGWSRCFINRTQNQSAGGSLVGFYRAERMLDRDPFQVGYLP